jgi:hypothetical protein
MTPYHAAALAFGHGLRLLPRRLRWPALMRAARVATPLIRRAGAQEEPGMGIDSWRDIALWRLMMSAAEALLRYDPVVEHRGLCHVDAALNTGRGVLLVAPHSLLGYVSLRLLRDRGRDPVAVVSGPAVPIFGTGEGARIISVSESLLAEGVRTLRAGGILCAMIDRPGPEPNAFEMTTPLGPLYISDAFLRFALREQASILFCTARVEDDDLIVTWGAPPPNVSSDKVGREFAIFVAERLGEGHGSDGPRAQAFSRRVRAIPVQRADAAPADRSGTESCSSHRH